MPLRAPVTGPPARPPRFGLLAAAPVLDDGERWELGYAFQPEACGESGRLGIECNGNTGELVIDYGPGVVEGDPFVVFAGDRCGTFGFRSRDWQGRARRQLEATQSYEIAAELWGGSLGLAQRSLTDPAADTLTTAGAGGEDPVDALACVEQGIGTAGRGRQGMVHVTQQVLTHLASAQAVVLSGSTWVTPNGNLVVADAGYDGSGPNGEAATADTQWMYGTGIVGVRLGAVDVTPTSIDEARALAGSVDRSLNDLIVYAQRPATFQWDECVHVAAEVNIGTCLTGGAS